MLTVTTPTLPSGYDLRVASTLEDFAAFARLACAYHAWLGVDLRFQNFEQEIASLPGSYGAPTGCILLVSHKTAAPGDTDAPGLASDVACVAIRPLEQHEGEQSSNNIANAAAYPSTAHLSAAHPQQAHASSQSIPVDEHNEFDATGASNCTLIQNTCELKRLWVDQQHQSQGLGRSLITAALDAARQLGYKKMVLDTLNTLSAANKLYEQLGFERRKPYYYNPLPGVVYWEKEL